MKTWIQQNVIFNSFMNKRQYEQITYSKVISGKLELLRFDTLLVGTFDAQLTNGIDTITLTDGKFDYQLTTY